MDRVPHAFELTSASASEPVTLTEAKAHLRVVGTDEDTYITGLIAVAREKVEVDTERALITQTRRLWIDDFPRGNGQVIDIPLKPVSAVTLIEYWSTDEEWVEVDDADYVTDVVSAPGRIWPASGVIWPTIQAGRKHAVRITLTCGAAANSVPAAAKHAMKLLIGHWFENREAVGKVPTEISLGYEALIGSIKWH